MQGAHDNPCAGFFPLGFGTKRTTASFGCSSASDIQPEGWKVAKTSGERQCSRTALGARPAIYGMK